MSKAVVKKKLNARTIKPVGRTIAAGEFKAKCLRIMDELNETGQPIIVTKRGQASVKIMPIANGKNGKKDDIFGRLEGILQIHGDPDDLVNPIIPSDDWNLLK